MRPFTFWASALALLLPVGALLIAQVSSFVLAVTTATAASRSPSRRVPITN